jgi:riboflavin kinase / FMN adenylyltransferase
MQKEPPSVPRSLTRHDGAAWYAGKVLEGNHLGRTIGFPTLNLDPAILPDNQQEGVYASTIRYDNRSYIGALYVGPRLVMDETKRVLEIHLLNFDQIIYGKSIRFQLGRYIRDVQDFGSFEELKIQLIADRKAVEKAVSLL